MCTRLCSARDHPLARAQTETGRKQAGTACSSGTPHPAWLGRGEGAAGSLEVRPRPCTSPATAGSRWAPRPPDSSLPRRGPQGSSEQCPGVRGQSRGPGAERRWGRRRSRPARRAPHQAPAALLSSGKHAPGHFPRLPSPAARSSLFLSQSGWRHRPPRPGPHHSRPRAPPPSRARPLVTPRTALAELTRGEPSPGRHDQSPSLARRPPSLLPRPAGCSPGGPFQRLPVGPAARPSHAGRPPPGQRGRRRRRAGHHGACSSHAEGPRSCPARAPPRHYNSHGAVGRGSPRRPTGPAAPRSGAA